MMNIDWFRPYKTTTYSVGEIYLVIVNLPREEHFLPENVIICGVIPGPCEPKKKHQSLPFTTSVRSTKAVERCIHGYSLVPIANTC